MQISLDFFAGAIRALMRKQGFTTQKEVAEAFGVEAALISAWLNPKSRKDLPGDKMLPKIAELSGHDLDKLLLYKRMLKWQDEGLDMEALKNSVISLSDDQASVIDMMNSGDYVGAAQFLLGRSRLSA
ncbi:MAG: helix-turn-helix domain-containing protein [Bryobacteraceae bacterium]